MTCLFKKYRLHCPPLSYMRLIELKRLLMWNISVTENESSCLVVSALCSNQNNCVTWFWKGKDSFYFVVWGLDQERSWILVLAQSPTLASLVLDLEAGAGHLEDITFTLQIRISRFWEQRCLAKLIGFFSMGSKYFEKREQALDLHDWLDRADMALEQQWM